jgi:EAL and modified HD-GYP domain-containing signal transduction protein
MERERKNGDKAKGFGAVPAGLSAEWPDLHCGLSLMPIAVCADKQINQVLAAKMDTLTQNAEAAVPSGAGEVRFIARQPILDRQHCVHGYALLFDSGSDGIRDGKDREVARTLVDDMVLIGLDRLTGGLPAFIRCSSEAVSEQLVAVLPPATTVLALPESVKLSNHLLEGVRALKEKGFRLSLVDYTGDAGSQPLFELADYVKVDLNRLNLDARHKLQQRIVGTKIALIDEKVDTQEDFKQASAEGFSFFQGVYFCYPELIQSGKIPANRLFHMDILRQLQSDPLDLKKISPLVMRDAALVLRLLRLVNSPLCAVRTEVQSIESAIVMLGENTFRRIANLAILREINTNQPAELLHMALVRGRFCQLSAPHANLDPGEQYLLGLMSLLPAMLRTPMEALAKELPLRPEIRQALLGQACEERCLLAWIEAHEQHKTAECYTISTTFKLNEQKLNQYYVDALMWDAAMPRNLG